jgi:hypothetical protein
MSNRRVLFVHDGQEFDFEIPEFCSMHPLPPEAVTAALDTLTVAVIGIVGILTAIAEGDAETANRRAELVTSTVMGMRDKLGFGGEWGGLLPEDSEPEAL